MEASVLCIHSTYIQTTIRRTISLNEHIVRRDVQISSHFAMKITHVTYSVKPWN